jgi:ATP-dependent Lhr-like helicase
MQEKDLHIKKALKEVWSAFFGRFSKLLPIQREVIPEILAKNNVIVISPAATGKTEAVCAPLARLLLDNKWEGLSVLYISPTKALVNDLYKRIEPPLTSLGISISRKTQDRPEFRPGESLANFLITTPEGFDSLICRAPKLLETIKAVCLDEIHLYDNTPRGDALRILLKRLSLITNSSLNYYGLSATVANPYNLVKRYFINNASVKIIVQKNPREIDYKLLPYNNQDDLKILFLEFKEKDITKILVFCNTRKEAESVTMELKTVCSTYPLGNFKDKIYLHHASLDKFQRESVEKLLNSSRVGIIVATMTLELGIDIGDIDCIVFISPPTSSSSLLQRLGRGNRRQNKVIAYGLYKTEFEKILFNVLFELAKIGWSEEDVYTPKISVIPQQILSYIAQRRNVGTTIAAINRIFSDSFIPQTITQEDLKNLISHLIDSEYIKTGKWGVLYMDDKLYSLFKRGSIHSNIEKLPIEYQIIDLSTAKVIGKVERVSCTFTLAGKVWSTEKVEDNKIYVKPNPLKAVLGKVFIGKGQALWNFRLGNKLKSKLFHNISKVHFITDWQEALPYFIKDDFVYIYHFLGLIYGYIWQEILLAKGMSIYDEEGLYLVAEKNLNIKEILNITKEEIKIVLKKKAKNISKLLNLGEWFFLLPQELKDKAIEEAFCIERFYKLIKNFKPVLINLEELIEYEV